METIYRTAEWFCLGNSIRSESACLEKDAKENGFGGERWKWVMARNGASGWGEINKGRRKRANSRDVNEVMGWVLLLTLHHII